MAICAQFLNVVRGIILMIAVYMINVHLTDVNSYEATHRTNTT